MPIEPPKQTEQKSTQKNIATMTATELWKHIKVVDEKHRSRMKALRALARARQAEEYAKE